MNRDYLQILARTPQGLDAAIHRIFCQTELEESDHEFLLERLETLNKIVLLCWLRRRPPYPVKVAQALVEQIRKTDFVFEILGFADDAARMPDEALNEIAIGTRTLLPNGIWWHVVRWARGTCPTFSASLQNQWHWRISDRLFEHRYDEQACRRELVQMVREAEVEKRVEILQWIEANGLLDILSPADVLPDEVAFPFERIGDEARVSDGYFLMLAKRWRAMPAAREWLLDQAFRAIDRGVDWSTVWRVLPKELQDEMALRSLDTESIAPWTILTIVEAAERGEPGVLERLVFPHLEKLTAVPLRRDVGEFFSTDSGLPAQLLLAMGIDPDEQRVIPKDKAWTIFRPMDLHAWICVGAPLPDDESLDQEILERGRRYDVLTRNGIVQRMSTLPLTRSRANRVLRWAIEDPQLLKDHFIPPEAMVRLVEIADPLPPERLPPVNAFFWYDQPTVGIAAYRKLGGDEAAQRLRAWALEPLEGEGHIVNAVRRMRLIPDIVAEEMNPMIARFVERASFAELRRLREEAAELVSEERLLAAANACAEDPNDHWSSGKHPSFAAEYADAIRRRVRVVRDEWEWDGLMQWLVQHGEPYQQVIELAKQRIEVAPNSHDAMNLLRGLFENRTRWVDAGPRVLEWLLEKRGTHAVVDFIEQVFRNDALGTAVNLQGMQEALALLLIKRAAHGINGGNERLAIAALHGLVALHPPTRLCQKVRGLRKLGELSPPVAELVDLNERLLRHESTREASWLDARAALSLYKDSIEAA